MLRDYRAGSGSFVRPAGEPMPMGHMLAKNSTGANLGFGDAAMYRETGYTNTTGPTKRDYDMRRDFLTLVQLDDLTSNPATPFGGMAIALEPIENNQMGRVAIAGLAIVNMYSTTIDRVYLQPTSTAPRLRASYWGFGRVLAINASPAFSLVDLSDRKLQVAYTLTANMSSQSATATLGDQGGATWTTTVHDPHNIAAFQLNGQKGFAEWRGDRWVVTIPFC